MAKKIYYHGGEIEVRLGDLVETSVFLFWRCQGRVVYVPGVSPKHPEMEFGGLVKVAIKTEDSGMIGTVVIPETRTLRKKVKFIARDPDGRFEEVKPDEVLLKMKNRDPGTPVKFTRISLCSTYQLCDFT